MDMEVSAFSDCILYMCGGEWAFVCVCVRSQWVPVRWYISIVSEPIKVKFGRMMEDRSTHILILRKFYNDSFHDKKYK